MYALSTSEEGNCSRCVPPDPGIAAAALGASESSTPPGTAPAEALHTFTLDSGASRCFFHDKTTLTPLPAPVPVRLADPSGGPIVAHSFTVLSCPAVPSGSLSCLHLPSFSTNLGRCVSSGFRVWSSSRLLLVSPPIAPDSSLAPPSGSPIPASPSWHALSSSCLWPPQVSASPAALAYPALPSLRRGAAEHRSSLFLVPSDDCSPADSPHGRVGPSPRQWTEPRALLSAGTRLQLCERFGQDLPLLRLHSDRGGEFSSTLLRDFCHGEGILQSFMLLDSPQQNGIAERRIGLVMEVARTSMIDAAAPHFLWPFSVRHAAHQLNLWPRVSLLETSPTLRWTGEVGDASVFRVWGSRAFVRDTSADKLSPRAIPCVFLGFVPDAPGWQFYHPTLRRGPAPSSVSQVDPLPDPAPVQTGGAEPGAVETGGAEPEGVATGGGERGGVEPGGAASKGAESGGEEPRGAASSGGSAGASPRLSLQQLREWFVRRTRLQSGAFGAGGAGAAGAGDTGGTATAGPGGARTRGTGAAGTCDVEGAGARAPMEPGAAGAGGTGAGGAGAGGAGAAGVGDVDPGAGGPGDTVRPRPYFVPLLQQILGVPCSTGLTPPLLCPPPDQSQLPLQPASPLPAPSPYTEESGGLRERREPASCPVLPIRTTRRVPRSRPPSVPVTHAMTLPSPLSVGGECALVTDVLEDRQDDFESLAAAVPCFASMLLAPEGDPDAPDIPTPRSYAEAITVESSAASLRSPPVYDLVFATAETEALTLVKSELQKRHTYTDLGELRSYLGLQITRDRARHTITLTQSHMVHQVLQRFGFQFSSPQPTPLSTCHSLSAPPSDESVEPSGPYPELVDCLMYLMMCTRPDLAYPLSLLARYVAPGRHRKVHWDAAKRVLRYLCSTSGMGLVLGGRGPVVLTGHADASWVDDSATQRTSQGYTFNLGSGSISWRSTRSPLVLSSICEAEIYAGAMAAQELRWLTYLLTDLGEQPRSPPVLYVDNKAMIALCQEHRLEHRTKHIALRYFLARELQQRGRLCLAYVATRANTADVFTKALPPGDHQRFVTVLGLLVLLFLTGLVLALEVLELEELELEALELEALVLEVLALGQTDSLTERREPESRPASPVCAVCTGRRVPCPRPLPVPGTHVMALRPSSVPLRIPLPSPLAPSLADGLDPESDLVRTVSRLLLVGEYILLIVYVDDLLYIGSTDDITNWFQGELQQDLSLTVSSTVTQYLGLNILDGEDAIYLSTAKYADTIAKRFGLSPASISTPYHYTTGNHQEKSNLLGLTGLCNYQRKLCCLLFAAVTCRPDLSYSASQLATHLKRPEA
ncbi:unnamed protein product [Closterium sp. NIES-53]